MTTKRVFKKMIIAILALSLIGTGVPMTTLAAIGLDGTTETKDVPTYIDIDPVTYNNVATENIANPKLFIKDLLNFSRTINVEPGELEKWEVLAEYFSTNHGSYPDHDGQTASLKSVLPNATISNGRNTGSRSSNDDTWNVYNTGLQNADSMKQAQDYVESSLIDWYEEAGGSDSKASEIVKKVSDLNDDDAEDLVYYSLISAHKTSGKNKKGHYKAFAIYFSDFKLTPILLSDSEHYTVYETDETLESVASNVALTNNTGTEARVSQNVTLSESISESNTIENSKEYGFKETLEVGVEKKFGNTLSTSISMGFEASQVISKSWSNTEAMEQSETIESSVSATVPAYTHAFIKQITSMEKETTYYECPVALSYRVTVVEYFRDPNSNDSAPTSKYLLRFGDDARSDLYEKAFVNTNLKDTTNNVVWADIFEAATNTYHLALDRAAKWAPMSGAGAVYSISYESIKFDLGEMQAILPLDRVDVTSDIYNYTVNGDDTLRLSTVEVQGYNDKDALYYGFSQGDGKWVVCDKNGNEVESDIVSISGTKATNQVLEGLEDGTVYLKYLIDENTYACYNFPDTPVTNDDIDTVIIKVTVTENEKALMGDVNFDNTVDTTDAQAIFNHFMGLATLSEDARAVADINGDGNVDTTDAQAAFNIFMGI